MQAGDVDPDTLSPLGRLALDNFLALMRQTSREAAQFMNEGHERMAFFARIEEAIWFGARAIAERSDHKKSV